jgi:hypothetical protein
MGQGIAGKGWARFGVDLIVAGVLYVMWERLTAAVGERKEEFRRKIEGAPQDIRLLDALAFSLLSTDTIYENIPPDRLRLIVISYTLIALGLVAAFANIGPGLMPLVVSGALVLGAVPGTGSEGIAADRVEAGPGRADVAHAQGGSLPAGIRDHGYFRTRSKCWGGSFRVFMPRDVRA